MANAADKSHPSLPHMDRILAQASLAIARSVVPLLGKPHPQKSNCPMTTI